MISVPCTAADIFYAGAIVWALAAGKFGVAPAAGDRAVGICCKQVTTTAADQLVDIYIDGVFEFPTLASVTVADTGSGIIMPASGPTDNPADCVSVEDATLAVNDCYIGRIVSWLNSKPIVRLDNIGTIMSSVTAGSATVHWGI